MAIKKIFFMDATDFNMYMPKVLEKRWLFITLRDPGMELKHKLPFESSNILNLEFTDTNKDFEIHKLEEMAEFIKNHLTNDIEYICISCLYGVSRSPAIATALAVVMKTAIFPVHREIYNANLYDVALEVFKKYF